MASVATLMGRSRRLAGDYPIRDRLSAQITNLANAVPVTEGGDWSVGDVVTCEGEDMIVRAVGGTGANTLTVTRSWNGTTAATHVITSDLLQNAKASGQDVLDGLNEALRMLWPYFFKRGQSDGTLTITSTGQADYAAPSPFTAQGRIMRLQVLASGGANDEWREYRRFEVLRGSGGVTLHFTGAAPDTGTKIRVFGITPFATDMDLVTGTTDAELPDLAVPALTMYTAHYILLQTEAYRVGQATAKNIGPAATQPGQITNLSGVWLQKFTDYCQAHAMPWPQWSTRRRF